VLIFSFLLSLLSFPLSHRYKYLSGLHHWSRGNDNQARTKWKNGVSHGDKHGMALWSNLCKHQLLRTESNHHVKIIAYTAVGKTFSTFLTFHFSSIVSLHNNLFVCSI